MPPLPPPMVQLLQVFAPAFSRPTFARALVLLCGTLLASGRRTVAAALRAVGLAEDPRFGAYHRVLSRARWSPLRLGRLLLGLVVARLVPADAPVVLLLDETLERRRGTRIAYKGRFRDAVRSRGPQVVTCEGVQWLVLAVLVPLPWCGRPWALPVLTIPALSPAASARLGRRHRTCIERAGTLARLARRWLPGRELVLVADGGFAAVALGHACRRAGVALVTRCRLDVALYDPPAPKDPRTRGRAPAKGPRQATLKARLADAGTAWSRHRVAWYGGRAGGHRPGRRHRALAPLGPAAPADRLGAHPRPRGRPPAPGPVLHRPRRLPAPGARLVPEPVERGGHLRGAARLAGGRDAAGLVPAHHPAQPRPASSASSASSPSARTPSTPTGCPPAPPPGTPRTSPPSSTPSPQSDAPSGPPGIAALRPILSTPPSPRATSSPASWTPPPTPPDWLKSSSTTPPASPCATSKSRGSQQQLLADFEDYLDGFSPNVQDILDNFKFRNQLQTLSSADAIGTLINKFLDPAIDLSPAGIDNHAMGTVFEELVRRFNEENNEEAGEHWTPRDAVRLMANLVFLPIEAQIKSGTYLLYDCACGTGGMLTVAEETLTAIAATRAQQVKCLLYGQEINPETYAVCKADMLLKGEGESADHIVGGAEWSTLAHDAFPVARVRLHARQSALRQELEEGPRSHGRQGRHARPPLQGDAQGRGAVAGHPLQRRAAALPRQHGLQDERHVRPRQPHRRGTQRLVALHRRRRPGREQYPPLADRERLARSDRRPAAQPVLQHRHRHLHLGALQPQARPPRRPGAADRRHPVVQAAAQEPRQEELRARARGHRAGSAAPSSISRKRPSRRSSPTPPSATGR